MLYQNSVTAALLLSACTLTAVAQSQTLADRQTDALINNNKIVYIDGRPAPEETQAYVDSIRRKISEFYYDQFRNFSDPAAPYFMFMSKDASLCMGIGGAVRMRGYYDWGGAMPAAGFAPYLIPMTPDPTSKRHLDATPAGTALFFRVIGNNKTLGDYQLNIETDFSGFESRGLKLKKAYAIINDFTVGYAASIFSDPAALPPVIDASGAANKITPTKVLIRYMPVIRSKWVLAASLETPSSSASADNTNTAKVDDYLPDVAAFVQYQWSRSQHIRLSGIVRALPYRDLTTGKNHTVAGWGMMFSSVIRPTTAFSTYAIVNYGHGYSSLGGDLSYAPYDLVGDPGSPGRLYAPATFGYCVGVQYNFRPELFVSANVSQARYLPSKPVSPDEYKYGMVCTANMFWNMTPRMQVGAEFNIGKRANFSHEHRRSRRAALMCMFSF